MARHFHMVYISRASRPLERSEIQRIALESSTRNKAVNITGVLLYRHGMFLQLLEGNPIEVFRLFDHIAADTRHEFIRQILQETTEQRLFPTWNMGLVYLDGDTPQHLKRLERVLDEIAKDSEITERGHKALAALQEFASQTIRPLQSI